MKKILLFFLLNGAVLAQDKAQEVSEILSKNTYEPNYFSMIFGLFVVVGMIYLTGFLYQKMIKVKLISNDIEVEKPEILSTTSLGQGRNLHVIKIGSEACLIGATQNSITFIKKVKMSKSEEKESSLDDKNC